MIILRQKDFARANYEGLTKRGQNWLKKERNKMAKTLKENRRKINTLENYRVGEIDLDPHGTIRDYNGNLVNMKRHLVDGPIVKELQTGRYVYSPTISEGPTSKVSDTIRRNRNLTRNLALEDAKKSF